MKKIKLLITSAALLVGGGLLASSSNNIMKANAAESFISYQFSSLEDNKSYDGNKLKEFIQDDNLMTITATGYVGGSVSGDVHYLRLGSKKNSGSIKFEYNETTLIDKIILYGNFYSSDGTFNFKINNQVEDTSTEFADGEMEINLDSTNWFSIATESSKRLNISKIDVYFLGEETGLTHTVRLMDGENEIGIKEVQDGSPIDFTDVQADKEDYVFEGWYTDSEFTTPFDVNTLVTEDLVLYAKYILISNLPIGEQFALQTTKKSLIANVSEAKSIITKNLTSNFTFNPNKNKLSTIGFDSKWSYDAKHNGSGTYPQISSGDLKLFTNKGNHSSLTMSYDGIINSISFKDISNLSKIEIRDEKGDIVSHLNGTYSFSDNNHSFTIYNSSDTNTTINDSFSIEYIDNVLEVTNSSIRFGTALSSKLYDETATYGVIFGLNGEDINTLAENETSVENLLINNKTLHSAQASTIAMVDTDTGAVEESKNPETAPYFQYAIVIKDMLEHIGEEITAACYMETNDNLYVMNEVTYSVKTLSNEYLNNIEEGTLSEDYKDILNAILNYNA